MKRILCSALLLAALCARSNAFANGRFPNAQQLREPAAGTLVVAGTYGLLVSGNAGSDFEFVCESALFGKALMGSWVDPLLETLPDGTIVSGSQNGLRVSRDRGCSFATDFTLPHDASFVGAGPDANAPKGTVVDVCPGYDSTSSLVALTTLHADDGSIVEHRIYKSADGARSWSALPKPLEKSQLGTVLTIDVAPSDPNRLYVSGSTAGQSLLAVSSDGGKSYSVAPIAIDDADGVLGAYIAAVSPTDPDRVYVRVSRKSLADDGSDTWDDSLLVSDDAGAHFRDVLRKQAALLGFALSPDGKDVLAGYGDPMVAPVVTSDDALGLYAAKSDALVFAQRVPNLAVSCLRWTATGVYACAKENDPLGASDGDFHVGLAAGSTVPANLQAFKALLKLRDVRGPLPWDNGMVSACADEWQASDPNSTQPNTCAAFNACTSSHTLSADVIRCGGTMTGSGGASETSSGGRSETSSGGAVSQAGQATSGAASTPYNHSSGCSCRLRDSGRPEGRTLLVLALIAYSARRRRKSSDACPR